MDNFVFGALLIAFVVYITAKGELATYLQMFFYTPPSTTAPAKPFPTGGAGGALGSFGTAPSFPGQPELGQSNPFAGGG